jgi:hypothetical protein
LYLWVLYDSQRKRGCLFLNSVNKLIAVMVKCDVLFEVRAEVLFRRASASGVKQSQTALPCLNESRSNSVFFTLEIKDDRRA